MKKVIILSGPTASGKSSMAIDLAQYFNLEIVSADSMAIYKYMDIGTDKPSIYHRSLVKHHMVDIVDPRENYSVYLYSLKAKEIINLIHKRNKIPLIVGGTGLYIESFFHTIPQTEPNWEFRNRLYELEYKNPGILYRKLKNIDPDFANKVDKNNIKRLIRALEIYEMTKKLPSIVRNENLQRNANYNFLNLYVDKERKKLYNKIDSRVDSMIERGLVEETKFLLKNGYFGETSSKAIGYKEVISYIQGEYTFDRCLYLLKRNSRRYAKRQIIWFRRYSDFLKVESELEIFKKIKKFLRGD
jgi:tRNA dimethylallyltransferase